MRSCLSRGASPGTAVEQPRPRTATGAASRAQPPPAQPLCLPAGASRDEFPAQQCKCPAQQWMGSPERAGLQDEVPKQPRAVPPPRSLLSTARGSAGNLTSNLLLTPSPCFSHFLESLHPSGQADPRCWMKHKLQHSPAQVGHDHSSTVPEDSEPDWCCGWIIPLLLPL